MLHALVVGLLAPQVSGTRAGVRADTSTPGLGTGSSHSAHTCISLTQGVQCTARQGSLGEWMRDLGSKCGIRAQVQHPIVVILLQPEPLQGVLSCRDNPAKRQPQFQKLSNTWITPDKTFAPSVLLFHSCMLAVSNPMPLFHPFPSSFLSGQLVKCLVFRSDE